MKHKLFSLTALMCLMCSQASAENDVNIAFADATVKNLCVKNWDTDGDGELSYAEAQAVKSIGTVFSSNESITSFDELQYFTGISSIDMNAFYYCSRLESLVLPASVKKIGKYAFCWCASLQHAVLSENLQSIGEMAFYQCTELPQISLPEGLQSIGNSAFLNCQELESIEIPSTVTFIGGSCFASCYKLASIIVDADNTTYNSGNGSNAIIESKSKTLITGCQSTVIPTTVTSIGEDAFSDCPDLSSIEIPNSVTKIGGWAFCACTGLTSVKLPDTLEEIGPYAFAYSTTIRTLEIPESVTVIDEHAFDGCYALKSVVCHVKEVFATGASSFRNCGNAVLYVQGDLIEQYQTTADWNRFKSIAAIPATIMIACNDKGTVSINGGEAMSAKIGELVAMDGAANSFMFTPNDNCLLSQVLVDGTDLTNKVANNSLNAVLNDGSQVIISFRDARFDMDVNHDGSVDISDVVTLVNFILGQ